LVRREGIRAELEAQLQELDASQERASMRTTPAAIIESLGQ